MSKDNVSVSVIRRLPRYYRFLEELMKTGATRISSRELSEKMGLTASQIRQDLNCFGGFGQQGYGYNISDLHDEIGNILGASNGYPAVLFGAGNLGKAIASHLNFQEKGCKLIGVFDSNPMLEGKEIGNYKVMMMDKLDGFCKEHKPVIAILCIPKEAAQELADKMVSLGITAFWNFSHYDLRMNHEGIVVENVHLGDSLLTLTYGVTEALHKDCNCE